MVPAFQPLRTTLYSVEELTAGFRRSDPSSFADTADFRIFRQYVACGRFAPRDYLMALLQAVHDNAIRDATQRFLEQSRASKAVGFMGGHDLPRDHPAYAVVAQLARALSRRGYLTVSGGGPGAMEAVHLGAAHRYAAAGDLERALRILGRAPQLPAKLEGIVKPDGSVDRRLVRLAHAWSLPAAAIRRRIARPGVSLAVPTWLYGHEPTTWFATHIAKYFQNSVREDRLLSIATHGVIYVEGRAGTVQEIFQDAALNFYRILGDFSPMILFGRKQWTEKLPVTSVLRPLLGERDFRRFVHVTDEPGEVLRILGTHRRAETPSRRLAKSWNRAGIRRV